MSTTHSNPTAITVQVKEPWHQTPSGRLVLSVHANGITVRVQQRKAGGAFYRVVGSPESWKSLETTDQSVAQDRAEAFLRALVTASAEMPNVTVTRPTPARPNGLTLGKLFNLYLESETFDKNKAHTKLGDTSRSRIMLAGLGEDLPVDHLCDELLNAYLERRAKGGIVYERPCSGFLSGSKRCEAEPGKPRTLAADVRLLKTVLNWAHSKYKVNGRYLLAEMPIRKFPMPSSKKNAARPVATVERFQRTLAALEQYAHESTSEGERRIWLLTAFALVLVESAGRRISAVLHLKWKDFDATMPDTDIPAIFWDGEHDKKGVDRWSPKPPALSEVIDAYRRSLGAAASAASEWVFGQVGNRAEPYSDDQLGDKLLLAEARADLPKLKGGLWHPYRRKWATERQDLPIKAVMAAGGWDDVDTFLRSYVKANPHTQLDVMSHPTKLHGDGKLRAATSADARDDQPAGGKPALRLVG